MGAVKTGTKAYNWVGGPSNTDRRWETGGRQVFMAGSRTRDQKREGEKAKARERELMLGPVRVEKKTPAPGRPHTSRAPARSRKRTSSDEGDEEHEANHRPLYSTSG